MLNLMSFLKFGDVFELCTNNDFFLKNCAVDFFCSCMSECLHSHYIGASSYTHLFLYAIYARCHCGE